MLKVLIVDDEYMVLKGLEAMIGTQQLFLVQIQTAMDAEDALEKIEKWIPDVVIADVNMPEIDGLQMIELARQRGSRCRFIICTGYDEVEYLHRAIRQQVAEYLLKPIEREILLHKLQELDREKQIENGEMLSLMKTRLLFRQSDTPVLSPEEQCALFPEEEYRLLVIPNEGNDTPEEIQTLFNPFFSQAVLLHRSRNIVLLLACPPVLSLSAIREIIRSLLKEKARQWGCSSSIRFIEDGNAVDCRFFYEAVSDLILSALSILEKDHEEIQNVNLRPVWLWNPEEDGTYSELLPFLQHLWESLSSPELAFAQMFADFSASTYYPSSLLPESSLQLERFHAFSTTKCYDVQSLYHAIVRLFGREIPEIQDEKQNSDNADKIERAVAYILRNYREDLSLDSVAQYVSLHPSYLSYLFKKKNGESFLHFLHKVRLQEACRLMSENPDLSLERISELVGYRTSTYFYKAFRQYFGKSPRDWQKREG